MLVEGTRKLLKSACEGRGKILNEEEWMYTCYLRIITGNMIEETLKML